MAASHSQGRHGFTLIEILAVILIIGLTFGFVLPNLDSSRSRKLEDRAREIANLVHVARQGAITSTTRVRTYIINRKLKRFHHTKSTLTLTLLI